MYNVCSDSYYFHVFHNDTFGILGTKSRMSRIGYLPKLHKFSCLHTVRTFPKSNRSENRRSRGTVDIPDIYRERVFIL